MPVNDNKMQKSDLHQCRDGRCALYCFNNEDDVYYRKNKRQRVHCCTADKRGASLYHEPHAASVCIGINLSWVGWNFAVQINDTFSLVYSYAFHVVFPAGACVFSAYNKESKAERETLWIYCRRVICEIETTVVSFFSSDGVCFNAIKVSNLTKKEVLIGVDLQLPVRGT